MSLIKGLYKIFGDELLMLRQLGEKGDNRTTGVSGFWESTTSEKKYIYSNGEEELHDDIFATLLPYNLTEKIYNRGEFSTFASEHTQSLDGNLITIPTIDFDLTEDTGIIYFIPEYTNTGSVTITVVGNPTKSLKRVNEDTGLLVDLLLDEMPKGSLVKFVWNKSRDEFLMKLNKDEGIVGIYGKTKTVTGSVVIDKTTPVQVVASAYTTSASARPQRLSNGWQVTAVYDTGVNVKLYVSKDNYATLPTLLCTISGTSVQGWSLASNGTTIHFIYGINNSQIRNIKFDALDGDGNDVTTFASYSLDITDTQTAINSVDITIDVNNPLHLEATASTKNATYPNSFNIRSYTTTDGGVTWSAPVQLTDFNVLGNDCQNPSIIIFGSVPYIIHEYKTNTPAYNIFIRKLTGLTPPAGNLINWSYTNIYAGGSFAQTNPSADVLSDGTIIVAWHGTDATDNSATNIRFSESFDNGQTWETAIKLTTGNTYFQADASITRNSNDEIQVVFRGKFLGQATFNNILKLKRINDVWGSIESVALGSNYSQNQLAPSTVNNYRSFSESLVAFENQGVDVKFAGKWTEDATEQTILNDSIETGNFVYCSQPTELFLDSPIVEIVDHRTPVQVVASAYSTEGNGGRKIVRLDNGTLISCLNDTISVDLKVFKSIDEGLTWTQITFNSSLRDKVSVCTDGIEVFILGLVNTTTTVGFFSFNLGNVIPNSTTLTVTIDSGQTLLESCSLAIAPNGDLHATWSSVNVTTNPTFNIRYSKSTDGGATWDAVTPLTTDSNISYVGYTSSSIVIKSDGYPLVVYSDERATIRAIRCKYFNGSIWTTKTVYSGDSNQSQSNPTADVMSDGRIIVAWSGKDAVESTVDNIRYSDSGSSGAFWSSMLKVTTGNTENKIVPSIVRNADDDIYIAFTNYDGKKTSYIKRELGMWGIETDVASNTGLFITNPSFIENYRLFIDPLMIFMNDTDSDVKFYGRWIVVLNTQIIPVPDSEYQESEMIALGSGQLKTIGDIDLQYAGSVSPKALRPVTP